MEVLMELNGWLDSMGMIHPDPMPTISDNGMLFISEYLILKGLTEVMSTSNTRIIQNHLLHMAKLHETAVGVYLQKPWCTRDPASHDNITGLLCASDMYSLGLEKTLKIWGRFWHPRDLIFYNYLKGGYRKVIASLFLWVLFIINWNTMRKNYETGETTIATSTKILMFFRLNCLKEKSWLMNQNWKLVNWMLKRKKPLNGNIKFNSWYRIFKIYFPVKDHPTPQRMLVWEQQKSYLKEKL